jgi:transcriptional regulatory protein LevR
MDALTMRISQAKSEGEILAIMIEHGMTPSTAVSIVDAVPEIMKREEQEHFEPLLKRLLEVRSGFFRALA